MTEAELAAAFSEALGAGALSVAGETPSCFVPELQVRRGRPDFVLSSSKGLSEVDADIASFEALSDGSAAQLLALMYAGAPRTEDYLFGRLGVTRPVFRRTLSTLVDASLAVEVSMGRFVWSKCFRPITEFWAVELKLRRWKRALYQALTYRAFAHRSLIVMPLPEAERLRDVGSMNDFGVGLLGLDVGSGCFRLLSYPRKQEPRSRAQYFYAIGKYYETTSNLSQGPRIS